MGDASLEPDRARTITPGGYQNGYIKSRSTLSVTAGTYVFDNLSLEPEAKLSVNDGAGPVIIYVNATFTFRGSIIDAGSTPDEKVDLLVVVRGSGQTSVESPFKGTVYAPNGTLYLAPLNGAAHFGAFFGKVVNVEAGTIINHRPFAWSTLLPPSPVEWKDAPVVLKPGRGNGGGRTTGPVVETTPAAPVNFTIPDNLWVSSGSAGNGKTELSYRTPEGVTVFCEYRGGATTNNPTSDLDVARGRRYRFVSCSNGASAGSGATGTWFKLAMLGSAGNFKETAVQAHLGGGCSGSIPPPMKPEEVVVLREGFDWLTTGALAETDPSGNQALWHGLIYIERKEQLEALDRWRVKWSTMPFSRTYLDQYAGKCGRVEHASDSQGVFVYAVFPAKLFNIIRNFSLEAKIKNVSGYPPPFKVWVPSTPDDADYINSDGSLKYETLASANYAQWLQQQSAQLPWFGEGLVDDIIETVADVGIWVDDNVIDPAGDYIQDGISFVGSIWESFVDWVANAVDDVWESIQEGLGNFLAFVGDEIDVKLEVHMQERGPFMRGRMFRTWGAPVPLGADTGFVPPRPGRRPWLEPHGVQVRIRQWGWGFLPIMSEGVLPGGGSPVVVKAVEGAEGRGEDALCIELESDAGSITTDIIPNEVCGFDGPDFADFETSTSNYLVTNQQELHAMTQIVDSHDYTRTVIEHSPEDAQVLTGWIANTVTAEVNGGLLGVFNDAERAMALCLDFPSISQTTLATILTPLPIVSPLIMHDIWWPDEGGHIDSRVMTHEYGHFLMCDMLYYEDMGSALTPLMGRVLEGQNDSPDDTIAITTEAWADTFSMQVVGASNYIQAHGATLGRMGYCQPGATCMDFNFRNRADFPIGNSRAIDLDVCVAQTPDSIFLSEEEKREDCSNEFLFYDELARTQSIIHDLFDRADSANRETNNPWNGDVLDAGATGFSTAAYLAFADESVSLNGPDWRSWVAHWVANDEANSGPDVSPTGLLAALDDAARENNHNWCQRCEAFALHSTDATVGGVGPADVDAARAAGLRPARWAACAQGRVQYFDETPPDKYGNLSPSCQPCPPLQFSDVTAGGVCTPCPAGEVPRGSACEACAPGTVPGLDNECISCSPYEISVDGACVPCRFGEGADRATNTCQECTPDAVLDWRTLGTVTCSVTQTAQLFVPVTESPNDTCPDYNWVEINNLQGLVSQTREQLHVEALPWEMLDDTGSFLTDALDMLRCPFFDVHLRGHLFNAMPTGSEHRWVATTFDDGAGVWASCIEKPWCSGGLGAHACMWNVESVFTAQQIAASDHRIRYYVAVNSLQGTNPVPARLYITASTGTAAGCDIK